MKLRITLLAVLVTVSTVAFGQKSKKEVNWDDLDALVEAQEFRIESDWARAQGDGAINAIAGSGLQQPGSSGNRFNLINNFNFFEMKGETVAAYLPYYGRRQFGNGHYSENQSIEFDAVPRNLSIEKNEKKKRYEISFIVDQETENFQVHIQLYPSMKSHITVNSNQRFVIHYDGKVGERPDGEGDAEGK